MTDILSAFAIDDDNANDSGKEQAYILRPLVDQRYQIGLVQAISWREMGNALKDYFEQFKILQTNNMKVNKHFKNYLHQNQKTEFNKHLLESNTQNLFILSAQIISSKKTKSIVSVEKINDPCIVYNLNDKKIDEVLNPFASTDLKAHYENVMAMIQFSSRLDNINIDKEFSADRRKKINNDSTFKKLKELEKRRKERLNRQKEPPIEQLALPIRKQRVFSPVGANTFPTISPFSSIQSDRNREELREQDKKPNISNDIKQEIVTNDVIQEDSKSEILPNMIQPNNNFTDKTVPLENSEKNDDVTAIENLGSLTKSNNLLHIVTENIASKNNKTKRMNKEENILTQVRQRIQELEKSLYSFPVYSKKNRVTATNGNKIRGCITQIISLAAAQYAQDQNIPVLYLHDSGFITTQPTDKHQRIRCSRPYNAIVDAFNDVQLACQMETQQPFFSHEFTDNFAEFLNEKICMNNWKLTY